MAHAAHMLALFDALHEARRLLHDLENDDASGLGPLRDRIACLEDAIAAPSPSPGLLESALAVREEAFVVTGRHRSVRRMVVEMMD